MPPYGPGGRRTGLDAAAHTFAITTIFPHLGTVCSTDELPAALG